MTQGGLTGRLTMTVGLLTSGIVFIVAVAIAGLVYVQTELQIKRDLSRAASAIIRDELLSAKGNIGLQKQDGGQSLAVLLRNLDVSLYIRDASGSALASYGIYRTVGQSGLGELMRNIPEGTRFLPLYKDIELPTVGRVDTYAVPLTEGETVVGLMQLTRVNNMWQVLGRALLFALLIVLPFSWMLAVFVIRWGTKRTLSPLSELVSSVERLDVDHLPEHLVHPRAMDDDVRTLHRTLETLMARIRETIARQREISENVSHEFKTPLTRIATRLGVLSASASSSDKKILDLAIRELVDLGEQVDGLLDLAIYGSSPGQGVSIVLKPFLLDLVSRMATKGHRINLSIPESFEVILPQGHARIIFRNLLENAIKYAVPESEISVTATQTDTHRSIVVLNKVDPSRAFDGDVFKRKERGTAGRGYGLGLAIVRDIVHQLGLAIDYRHSSGAVRVSLRV